MVILRYGYWNSMDKLLNIIKKRGEKWITKLLEAIYKKLEKIRNL